MILSLSHPGTLAVSYPSVSTVVFLAPVPMATIAGIPRAHMRMYHSAKKNMTWSKCDASFLMRSIRRHRPNLKRVRASRPRTRA